MLVVGSVLGPVGTVAAAPGVSVTHANSQTTVQPGDTVTITATFEQTDANAPAMVPQLPDGWTITDTTAGTDWTWFSGQQTFLGNLALSDGDGVTGTYTHTYTVQVPSDASAGDDYTITSEGSVVEPASGNRLVDSASTTVTVEDTGTDNTPPTIDPISDQTVTEGDSATVPVSASDDDGDSVSLSLSQSPDFVTLSNGEITIAPGSGDAGTYTVDVTADDGTDTTTESFQVTVEEAQTNTPPTIDAISDQTVTEGDSATVPVSTSDDDGDSVSLSLSQSPDFVTLSNGEITIAPQSGDAANSPYTVTVEADDGTDTTTESFQVTVEEPTSQTGSALVEITPDSGNLDASTYGGGTYQVTNTGDKEITSVSFNLDTATLPDMVFDPQGTAGDPTGEGLNIVDEGGTGITTAEGGSEAFSQPHNGQNADDGYDVMTVEFDDFQSDETATFWADNDPTSIKGATVGSQEAGPVSGLELARSTVTVTYADGTTQTTQLMGDGSNGGATAVVTGDEAPAPTIGAEGVSLDSGALDGYHSAATVSDASQTITLSGEPGETFTLVRVEGELSLSNVPDADGSGEPGYQLEEFEANNLVAAEYYSGTFDSNGEATVPVTLTNSPDDDDAAGFNYFVAAHGQASGDMGLASNVVVLEYNPDAANTPPTVDTVTDQGVSQGGSTTVDVSASDDEGDSLSLSVSGPDWVTATDDGDGTWTLALEPGTDVPVGTYTVEVTADDGQATSESEEFAVYVDEPNQDGEVVAAINAGGPEYTTGDGTVYEADSANGYFTGGSTFTTGGSGTPSDPDIANTDDDTLYQSERYGDFSYEIPVSESGTYEVTLQFAEIYQGVSSNDQPDSSGPSDGTNENDRLFDVAIEGQTVVTSYDIFSEVGPLAASDKTYTVEVTDGTLNVEFSTVNDNAKISAIKVEQIETDSDGPGVVVGDDAPTDPDGDGKYEDVNGDGDVNVGDAQAIFANTDDPVVQNNVDAFDFNGDGSVNSGDAQALFANGLQAGDSAGETSEA